MKKHLLTLVIVMFAGMFASAQSLQFEWDGHVYENGETIICDNADFDVDEIIQHMQLRNLSSESINVVVKKEELQMVEGASNYFCWGMCYAPTVFESAPVTMEGNAVSAESDLGFHHNVDPDWTFDPEQWIIGISVVRYTAYNERNTEDKVVITVLFAYRAEGVDDNYANVSFSNAYPNPASSVVSFDYDFQSEVGNAVVVIYDMTGREVKSQEIGGVSGKANIDVAELSAGVYFYSLVIDGAIVKSNKITISR